MEELLNIVKERGIVKIIIDYKIEFELFELEESKRYTIIRIVDEMINNCIDLIKNKNI